MVRGSTAEKDKAMKKNAETPTTTDSTDSATVAEQGANVALEKVPSKKNATQQKGAPRRQKTAKTPAKAAKRPKSATAKAKPEGGKTRKKDTILALITRKNGATLEEIMAVTGWQKHSVRGAIATMGKTTKIESSKSDAGARTYKA